MAFRVIWNSYTRHASFMFISVCSNSGNSMNHFLLRYGRNKKPWMETIRPEQKEQFLEFRGIRKNRLIGKHSWDPHYFFEKLTWLQYSEPSAPNPVIYPLCPFFPTSSISLLTSELLVWSLTFLENLPSRLSVPGYHQWSGSENVSIIATLQSG